MKKPGEIIKWRLSSGIDCEFTIITSNEKIFNGWKGVEYDGILKKSNGQVQRKLLYKYGPYTNCQGSL